MVMNINLFNYYTKQFLCITAFYLTLCEFIPWGKHARHQLLKYYIFLNQYKKDFMHSAFWITYIYSKQEKKII